MSMSFEIFIFIHIAGGNINNNNNKKLNCNKHLIKYYIITTCCKIGKNHLLYRYIVI